MGIVGIWKDRTDLPDTQTYVRNLRKGTRLERLGIRRALRLMRKYAAGHSLEIPDALIAAAAIRHSAALWTRNRKRYPMPQLIFCNS